MAGLLQRAIGGFLDGAGQGAADANMVQMRADVEMEKQKAIEQFRDDLKNAPLNRISASAQQFAQQDVPVTPAPVTSLSADSAKKVGLDDGLQGDSQTLAGILSKARNALSDPTTTPEQKADAQGMIDQIGKQSGAQAQINADAVAGKTRKPTNDEALNSALNDAKINDPVAYQAGRAIAQDNTVNVPEGAMVWDRTTGKVLVQNTGKADRQQAHDDARADIESAKIDSREKIAQAKIEAAIKSAGGGNSQIFHVMQSYDNDIKAAQAEMRANNTLLSGMARNDPRVAAISANNKELLDSVRATQATKWAYARSAGINIPDSLAPDKPKAGADTPTSPSGLPAGAKQVGTSGGKPVYEVDGKRFIQQ
jgi:hypothetical protein